MRWGLRIARIDPSRRGSMDERVLTPFLIQEEFTNAERVQKNSKTAPNHPLTPISICWALYNLIIRGVGQPTRADYTSCY